MAGLVKGAIAKRASGNRPSPAHAGLAAMAAGIAAAALTYRVMRS